MSFLFPKEQTLASMLNASGDISVLLVVMT